MAKMKVVFSDDAIEDLKDIKQYISQELSNETAATKTLATITKNIRLLSDFPFMGTGLSKTVGIETEYRYILCENYMVFYVPTANTVQILRVLYSRRDYINILFGDLS